MQLKFGTEGNRTFGTKAKKVQRIMPCPTGNDNRKMVSKARSTRQAEASFMIHKTKRTTRSYVHATPSLQKNSTREHGERKPAPCQSSKTVFCFF